MRDAFDTDLPMQQPVKKLRERDIQAACVAYARRRGTYARKFSSPASRSVPDYILVQKSRVWFVEFKSPGKKATAAQNEEHEAIRAAGGTVHLVDTFAQFVSIYEIYDR